LEFYGCYYHDCPCKNFRDVKKLVGDTLAQRYERTMLRLEDIVKVGYLFVTKRK
jgi:hypothetical protein